MAADSHTATVRWSPLGHALRALLADADAEVDDVDDVGLARFASVVGAVTGPLVLIDELGGVASAAEDGDAHAIDRLADLLRPLVQRGIDLELPEPIAGGCCDPCLERRPRRRGAHALADVVAGADLAADAGDDARVRVEASDDGVLDETAATEILATVGRLAADGSLGPDITPEKAMDAVLAVIVDAQVASGLVAAHRADGGDGVARAFREAVQTGFMGMVAPGMPALPPMRPLMGGAMPGMPGMPEMPEMPGIPGSGLPGLPDMPGLPGLPDRPKRPGTLLDEWLALLLGRFKKPRPWDPDSWGPWYPWWWERPNYIDPRTTAFIACIMAARRILRALEEPPPPPPAPPRAAVWNTGITGVSLSGPCAGETITIRGAGFGESQPANTVLLLPTLDGCRAVEPLTWSDARITAVLPARVSSGAVGFGDRAYIDAYNAWVVRMNDRVKELNALRCEPRKRHPRAPFGTCPPATSFNVITAGVAEIVAFTANGTTAAPLAEGQHLTLRWTVRNAASVTITRDTPAAPSFAGASSMSTPQLVGLHAFGAVAHSAPAEWRYTLSVAGVCGGTVTRTVRVHATKAPQLRIETIQVTQSVQTAGHTVAMVENKPTIVRVLVRHGLGSWGGGVVPNVQGRVRMSRGGWSAWIPAAPAGVRPMQATAGTAITVTASPSFNVTAETLNFRLPNSWASGTARYQVEVRVNGYGAVGSYAGVSQVVTRNSPPVTYQRRRTLQLRYVRVNWNGAGAPTAAQCVDTLRGAVPLLPTPTAGIAPVPGLGVENRSSGTTDAQIADERRDMLDDFEDLHNCSFWEEITDWLTDDCPDDDGAIWVLIPGNFQRGEAYDIPSNVCYTPPLNGPYAAHELAHCLDQSHVRLPATGTNAPTGGDAATAWPNGAMLVDVPFDSAGTAGSGGGGANPRALPLTPGSGVADVMTYWGTPNGTWPMPERWTRLWNEIGG